MTDPDEFRKRTATDREALRLEAQRRKDEEREDRIVCKVVGALQEAGAAKDSDVAATVEKTLTAKFPPSSMVRRLTPIIAIVGTLAAGGVTMWTCAGDHLVTTREAGDKLKKRVTTIETAVRQQKVVTDTMAENIVTIGQSLGVPVKVARQPDLLPPPEPP